MLFRPSEEGDHLYRLSQPHFVGEYRVEFQSMHHYQPVETDLLVGMKRHPEIIESRQFLFCIETFLGVR